VSLPQPAPSLVEPLRALEPAHDASFATVVQAPTDEPTRRADQLPTLHQARRAAGTQGLLAQASAYGVESDAADAVHAAHQAPSTGHDPSDPGGHGARSSSTGLWAHHDDHDALSAEFFSSNPPAGALDVWEDDHPAPSMSKSSRRAMYATLLIFGVSLLVIGGFAAYHQWIMPTPVELGGPLGASLPAPAQPLASATQGELAPAVVAPAAIALPAALPASTPTPPPSAAVAIAAPAAPQLQEAPPAEPAPQPSAAALHVLTAPAAAARAPVAVAAAPRAADRASTRPAVRTVASAAGLGDGSRREVAQSYGDLLSAGQALNRRGQRKQALEAYHRALALQPSGAEALSRIAYIHLNAGDNRLAKEYAGRAVAASPSSSEGWIVLGAALAGLGDKVGAQSAYHKCAVLGTGTYARECQQLAH
jgi:hypothetical protein